MGAMASGVIRSSPGFDTAVRCYIRGVVTGTEVALVTGPAGLIEAAGDEQCGT